MTPFFEGKRASDTMLFLLCAILTEYCQGSVRKSDVGRRDGHWILRVVQHTSGRQFELEPNLLSNVTISKAEYDQLVSALILIRVAALCPPFPSMNFCPYVLVANILQATE